MGKLERMGMLEDPEKMEKMDILEDRDQKVIQENQATLELLVRMVTREALDLKALPDQLAIPEDLVNLDYPEHQATFQVHLDYLVLLEILVNQDLQDLLDLL